MVAKASCDQRNGTFCRRYSSFETDRADVNAFSLLVLDQRLLASQPGKRLSSRKRRTPSSDLSDRYVYAWCALTMTATAPPIEWTTASKRHFLRMNYTGIPTKFSPDIHYYSKQSKAVKKFGNFLVTVVKCLKIIHICPPRAEVLSGQVGYAPDC